MDDLEVAHRLADLADRITGKAYRPGHSVEHELKDDGSPVTHHDRRVEEAVHDELARLRPGDAVVGEEIGAHGQSDRRWVIDGIDGTVSFVVGDPRWATQIALVVDDTPAVGISSSPAQRRRWWATTSTQAQTDALSAHGRAAGIPLQASTVAELVDATVTSIPPRERLLPAQATLLDEVLGRGTYVAPTTHGAKMVAGGQVDACLQLRGKVWDYAAARAREADPRGA